MWTSHHFLPQRRSPLISVRSCKYHMKCARSEDFQVDAPRSKKPRDHGAHNSGVVSFVVVFSTARLSGNSEDRNRRTTIMSGPPRRRLRLPTDQESHSDARTFDENKTTKGISSKLNDDQTSFLSSSLFREDGRGACEPLGRARSVYKERALL